MVIKNMGNDTPTPPPRISEDELKKMNADEKKAYNKQKLEWENYLQNESAEDRFYRVGKPRVERLMNDLDAFGKMVKSPRYVIPDAIFNNIILALRNSIDRIQEDHSKKSGTDEDQPSVTDKIFGTEEV